MNGKVVASWKEVAFGLSGPTAGAASLLTVPDWAIPILIGMSALPAIQVLKNKWSREVARMQQHAFGWHSGDLFGVYGSNEWQSTSNDSLFRPKDGLPPAPAFNFRGLQRLAATIPNAELVPADPNASIELTGHTLLVGGTKVTPYLAEFLNQQDELPFRFVDQIEIPEEFRPPEPPPEILRHFGDKTETFTRTSVTGRYLVDATDPGRPPFGPFVSEAGRITGDILVLTVARDMSGHRVAVANAGYGAADRLPEIVANGANLERLCELVPEVGATRIQAVFTMPVEHADTGEQYGEPQLEDVREF